MLAVLLLMCKLSLSRCILRHPNSNEVIREQVYVRDSATHDALLAKGLAFSDAPKIWYALEPFYSCDIVSRIGAKVGDGAKYVCNIHNLAKKHKTCIYYGFGVDGDISFEVALRKQIDCEMHTFDPTPSVVSGGQPAALAKIGITFHAWGLADRDANIILEKSQVPALALSTVMAQLHHTLIDILKIDIEGGEWSSLNATFASCDYDQPIAHQLQIELHKPTKEKLLEFKATMDRCGYRLFSKDSNYFCDRCLEVAYVHWQFVKCIDAPTT